MRCSPEVEDAIPSMPRRRYVLDYVSACIIGLGVSAVMVAMKVAKAAS